MSDDDPVEFVREQIEAALDELSILFRPGSELTFIMHTPGKPDQEIIVTTAQNLDEVIETIKRRSGC